MDLDGRVALITGGARRLGAELVRSLARAGCDVVINYNASAGAAESLASEISKFGRKASTCRADVASKQDVGALVEHVRRAHGRLDILVNNASTFERAPLLEISEHAWQRVLDVNLKGPFLLSQAAAPLLRERTGSIINMADLSAFQVWPSYAHHSVSKAGLVQLTRVLARALAPEIRVNCIAPGTVLPPEGDDAGADDGTSERRLLARTGSPEDVVRALFFLLQSNFITGQTVVVDGGRMLL